MENEALPETLTDLLSAAITQLQKVADLFLTPGFRQYQMFTIVGLFAVSYALSFVIDPKIENWVRSREGWPKWQLRVMVQVRRRLVLIIFALQMWAVYFALQAITWPSRSYLIGVAATLVTAWVLIAFLSRFVRNRTLRRTFNWTLWVYATLYALGFVDEVMAFLDGLSVSLGSVTISVLTILKGVVLIGMMLIVARITTQTASSSLRRNEDLSPSMQVLSIKAVQFIVYGAVFLIGIRALGVDLTGFALLSGAVGVGIGFGLQKVVSNLVSGIIILLDRSIKPGDVISLGETFGWINSLGARYVSVVTRDGKEYLIPNEDLITSQVVNWSHSDQYVRLDIFFGTSYSSDPHLVRQLAVDAAKSVKRVLISPNVPVCHIVGFGDSSVDYILRFWINDPTQGLTNIKGNVYLALWDSFSANDISIPFPQREVRMIGGSEPVDP
jgi:small-conductance mechanosensitive channel